MESTSRIARRGVPATSRTATSSWSWRFPSGEPRSLTADFDRSVGDFFWAEDGKSLYFEVEDRGDVNLCVVPAKGGAVKTVIGGETAGRGYHTDVAAGPKDAFFVYRHRPMAHTFEIFRCDKAGKNVKQITFANKDLYDAFFVPQSAEEYWWKARRRRRYPGLAHQADELRSGEEISDDGPRPRRAAADVGERFPHGVRALPGRGLRGLLLQSARLARLRPEVLRRHPRRLGRKAGRRSQGRRPRVLEKNSWIDAKRVGAWGDSYGGFFCNWLQGHNEDRMFAALVSHAGDADEWSSWGSTEELWFPEWDLTGTPWDKPEVYDRTSPIRYAKNFSTPHLFTHGDLDYRVPITGGETMFTALQRLGVPSKMIRFTDEGHWILKPQNQKFWYAEVLGWFDRWLKK